MRGRLKQAEALTKIGDYDGAVKECSVAKAIVFSKLKEQLPRIPMRLSRGDEILAQRLEHLRPTHGYRPHITLDIFKELSGYLEEILETMLFSLSKTFV